MMGQLVGTTDANEQEDEVFNTQGDHLYPKIASGHSLRLGLQYLMQPKDQLSKVARRFGSTLRDLMQLNPDIVASNQDANFQVQPRIRHEHLCLQVPAIRVCKCACMRVCVCICLRPRIK